jgi:hypothetical protein
MLGDRAFHPNSGLSAAHFRCIEKRVGPAGLAAAGAKQDIRKLFRVPRHVLSRFREKGLFRPVHLDNELLAR